MRDGVSAQQGLTTVRLAFDQAPALRTSRRKLRHHNLHVAATRFAPKGARSTPCPPPLSAAERTVFTVAFAATLPQEPSGSTGATSSVPIPTSKTRTGGSAAGT